jgi:release factor glutamine methyltransferase
VDGADQLVEMVSARLARAGCVAAEEEAIELVEAVSGPTDLETWVRRRERGEPLAWITGSLRFDGHRIHVDPGVYVPRPQTEELARRAGRLLGLDCPDDGDRRVRALDLCTGTGAVAVHLMAADPRAVVVGVDVDPAAAACARRNGVRSVLADLDVLDPPFRLGAFDVVTAVAPYVPTAELQFLPSDVLRFEPRRSLDGGPDGLRLVRRIVATAGRLLRPGGWVLLEVGGEQDRSLAPVLAASGFESVERWSDEDGDLRGIAACRGRARGRGTHR